MQNSKLKQIQQESEKIKKLPIHTDYISVQNFFNVRIQKVYDCLILEKEELNVIKKNFANLLTNYGDKTGYEASNTGIRIIDFFPYQHSTTAEQFYIAKSWMQNVLERIKNLSDKSIVFIFSYDNQTLTVRFHQKRDGEFWLADPNS
ncbi:hypothetical protein UAY_02433 [Enterococcus moraviensis ATCC BAA-383]|uniref:Uncharacterized protein n=1 Tax=Enterococcus moraviensis ATCC BAA-383 TaxID=1158609 RepID=R2SZI3_9ENTE|nr:hypothetical protein [Enterococcus moraviensis]EOH98186.1 hypothetical protein UAY_02433 [Enterococcus moraviensis ATCC BAA-383]EOT71662.1 hypothetical protein I586_01469 [Enterococcus moraviensis ATCC BAA-383]